MFFNGTIRYTILNTDVDTGRNFGLVSGVSGGAEISAGAAGSPTNFGVLPAPPAGELDWGDLVGGHRTLRAYDGASHVIWPLLHLGSIAPDGELDGSPTLFADGDGADEDGMPVSPVLERGQRIRLIANETISAMIQITMREQKKASILIVEDDPEQLRAYAKALRGYRLTCVSTGSSALESLRKELPDVILLDNILAEGERGIDFLPKLKAVAAHVPVIVISGTLDIHLKLQALQGPMSAHYTLEKPVGLVELESTVEEALKHCGLGETVAALQSLERAEKIGTGEPERRFTERLARQHEISNRLRENPDETPNVSALAREFGVDRHTIRRDLEDIGSRGGC